MTSLWLNVNFIVYLSKTNSYHVLVRRHGTGPVDIIQELQQAALRRVRAGKLTDLA